MNLNVKLDGEEEQPLQYVNRFAINIPSGAATFNLNIVNPGLGNQSFILNPVNPVGQNIVTYQSPMAVQSYIALPTEPEGSILHSMPVGVQVPVGLPVQTGLIQNPNFLNTGIIIGNEDCNTSGVLKSSQENNYPENELKVNYIAKTIENLDNTILRASDLESNCTTQLNSGVLKKPCPLEMSIKAANIDIEYEKCETEIPLLVENKNIQISKPHLLFENMPLEDKLNVNNFKVPNDMQKEKLSKIEPVDNKVIVKTVKTEITWDSNSSKNEVVNNDFQESLICEVEEVNDEDEEEEEEGDKCEGNTIKIIRSSTDNKTKSLDEESISSEENDALPLSVALKLKKLPRNKTTKNSSLIKRSKKILIEDKKKRKKFQKSKKQCGESDGRWSESDDDVLNLKRIKNDYNYKCYYEPGAASGTSLVLKIEDTSKKFVRVRSCCLKKECGKKISVKDQKMAYKNFYDLESNVKRDAYLINCIEHVQKNRCSEKENAKNRDLNNDFSTYKPEEKKLLENANIQLEIENESNGNQKLSDEIQNAIKESLKDCFANESFISKSELSTQIDGEGDGDKREKSSWNFYIVIDRCRKKVCLQFLLKLFRITKNRVKQLQKKILSGVSVSEDFMRTSQKPDGVWEMANQHLDGLAEECLKCSANRKHKFLTKNLTKEDLFINFKEYYRNRVDREPNIKYNSYKRFLDKETSVSFRTKSDGVCAECEFSKKYLKRKQAKEEKIAGKLKKAERKEISSDDEPLSKRKKLKITIPLKSTVSKTQKNTEKCNSKNNNLDKKKKGKNCKESKSRQSASRGRDVWSLMLLHLETMPFRECKGCINKKKHRFLASTFSTQSLFEDYRKYFLKETNSELGLGFTMYEKYFNRNCNYSISDVDENSSVCPRCTNDKLKS